MKKIITIILILASFCLKAQNDLTRSQIRDSIQALSSIVTLADLKNLLDYNFATSGVFKTDVIKSETYGGGTLTLDFDSIDTYEVDAGTLTPVIITISNMKDGQVGWIDFTNAVGSLVSWNNADDITPNKTALTSLSSKLYMVINKNNDIFSQAWISGSTITTATETNSGILEIATSTEAKAGTSDTKIITPDKLSDIITTDITIYVDTVAIGNWDMDALANKAVAHGIANYKNILFAGVEIINDDGTYIIPLTSASSVAGVIQGGVSWYGIPGKTTKITLTRLGGGLFDGTNYDDDIDFNRGWIIIWYIP